MKNALRKLVNITRKHSQALFVAYREIVVALIVYLCRLDRHWVQQARLSWHS